MPEKAIALAIMLGIVLAIVGLEIKANTYYALRGAVVTLLGIGLIGAGLYGAVHYQLG